MSRARPWLIALCVLLAFATKESGICVVVPVLAALWTSGREERAPFARRIAWWLPSLLALFGLMVVRRLVLGSLTGDPEADYQRQLATLLDLFPVLLFPTMAAPSSWLAGVAHLSMGTAQVIMLVFFGTAFVLWVAGTAMVAWRGNAAERRTLLIGLAWLLPQLGIYVWTGYYSPRHAYSVMFAVALVMVADLSWAVRSWRERKTAVALVVAPLLALGLLWVGTGPVTDSFAAPVAASRWQRRFLSELERELPRAGERGLVFAVSYPAFTLGKDDVPRFSCASPNWLVPALGHSIISMEGATQWLSELHPSWHGHIRSLLALTADAGTLRTPITIERLPDRVVVNFQGCGAHFAPSKIVNYVASLGPHDELLIPKARLGGEQSVASIFVFDGEHGSLEPFPALLELRLDPAVRGELYWTQGAGFGVPLDPKLPR
jgi:hypothetical protein